MAKFFKRQTVLFFCAFLCSIDLISGENDKLKSQVNYDYKDALSKAILFFEGQRSGKLPSSQRVTWRGDSALTDGNPDGFDQKTFTYLVKVLQLLWSRRSTYVIIPGKSVKSIDQENLVGGYYDAGDNVKFGWPMSFTTTLLSWAAIEFQSDISSAKQLDYLRQAIRWGTDFILKSHASSTTLYTQVGDGNADHQCWERPEDMDTPRTLYKVTSSSPGSEAVADASAALAAASIVFKGVDSNYSSKLLQHAKTLFDFADNYRGSYSASCPFYCSYSGYQDELLGAAAWLYEATKSSKYLDYVSNNKGWTQSASEYSWDNKHPGVQVLLAKEYLGGGKQMLSEYKSKADSFVCSIMPGSDTAQFQTTPGGLLFTRDTANLQYATSASMILSIYAKTLESANISGVQCGSTNIALSKIRSFTKSQVDYILGDNPMKMSYMVGYGSKFPQQVHHRGASIPSISTYSTKVGCNEGYSNWYNSNDPNPNVHVGAVVGGPDSNDEFRDERSDSTHSEPTTYINAAFVGAIAPLLSPQFSCSSTPLIYKASI